MALALLSSGISVIMPSPAHAQERFSRPWNLFDLFFPHRERRFEPPGTVPGARPLTRQKTHSPKKTMHNPPVKAPEPQAEPVEKQPDAKVVLVVGDFLSSGLAEGLATIYAENPNVVVVDQSKGSSGFVREDVFDWSKQIGSLIEAEKPAAVVVMLGSNDRQRMHVGTIGETLGTDNWNKEYVRRTDALAKAIAASKVPFVWVGMPPFRFTKMTADMLAFNDIYRAATEGSGGEFVDVWEGFVDDNGAFATTGPDVNGQPVRLRSDDGINFTRAGKRKLAFYAEKPLDKILGVTATPGAPASALPSLAPGSKKAAPVDHTPPISLNDPSLDGGSELMGARVGLKHQPPDSPSEKLTVEGIAPPPSPGRADDFSWPPASSAPTPAAPPTASAPPPVTSTPPAAKRKTASP